MESYNALVSMPNMTQISDENKNTFLFFSSDVTHEPMLLSEPDYIPAIEVDNTEYDALNTARFKLDGNELKMEGYTEMSHYHSNMAALMKLGAWLDYMRENGVYDNTKIIIVADHGQNMNQLEDLIMKGNNGKTKDVSLYFPLFLVKDFNSKEFATSTEFMTNADTPSLAFKDLIENPVNPFTGKSINDNEKQAHRQFIIESLEWQVTVNNGETFLPAQWCSVEKDIWDKENWEFYDETTVLKEHSAP